jgi:hypothetical protein
MITKFRGINRNDSLEELANVNKVSVGLRQLAFELIGEAGNSEIEVEINSTSDASTISAAVTVKVLGPPRRLPMTYTRDQIVEVRDQGRSIPKD